MSDKVHPKLTRLQAEAVLDAIDLAIAAGAEDESRERLIAAERRIGVALNRYDERREEAS